MNELIFDDEIGKMLYKTFFYNSEVFAIQINDNGKIVYKTKYERIDATKINYYLEQKKSILSYQQYFDKLRWICLDFDIAGNKINEVTNYDFLTDQKYKPLLLNEVAKCCNWLDQNNINYLKEYSGNRGIHIWIFFESAISKKLAFTILEIIRDCSKFSSINQLYSPVGLDCFPATGNSKNNKIGKGVKIPLSFHLKSKSYSFLIDSFDDIKRISNFSNKFIENQIKLLSNTKTNKVSYIIDQLKINKYLEEEEFSPIKQIVGKDLSREEILQKLCKSSLYKYLFDNINVLNENQRRVLVGTLVRIQTYKDRNFGINFLKAIFSSAENYDEELTNTKINLLSNLYPPNISYIENILGFKCDYCKSHDIKNVTDLLTGFEIRKENYMDNLLYWAQKSELNYLKFNDEVPLTFIEDELKNINFDLINNDIQKILNLGEYPNPIYYKYLRKEGNKERTLYSLSGKDRILSTIIMKYIYDIIGQNNISKISYSYRLNSSSQKKIFMDWNALWLDFVKKIQSFTQHEAYENYYVIKLDVKSFYDSINLIFLKEILLTNISNNIESKFINLNLSEERKDNFKNAVDYLITISEKIVGSSTGVPQGPAYARYLAEIYLTSFDEYIISQLDNSFDFAYRYVDDYYIFIKDIQKGEKLKDILINKLSEIYLEINSKFKYGIIKDIKSEIEVYNQLDKYFIDGIDESTPEFVKIEGEKIINKMYTDFVENDEIKDFPFFLTHLWSEDYLKKRANNLIERFYSISIGRGSMFKHFYNKVAVRYSNLEFFLKVDGLSRANLITSLMRNDNYSFKDFSTLFNNYLCYEDLKIYEKIELFRLVLIKGISVDFSIIQKNDFEIFLKLLMNIPIIVWSDDLFKIILNKIQNIADKIYSIRLLERILYCSIEIKNNKLFCDIAYSIIYRNDFMALNKADVQKLYNIIVYSTLFLDSIEQINFLWNKLLENDMKDIDAKQFFNFLEKVDFNTIKYKSVIAVLIQIFSDKSFISSQCANPLEKSFAFYLFLELYNSKSVLLESEPSFDNLKKTIETVAKQKNAIALLWSLEPQTEYFLDNETSLKNIEINNRLSLIKDKEILIRGPKEIFFDTVSFCEEMDCLKDIEFSIEPIGGTPLTNYQEMIFGKNIFEILSYSNKIIDLLNDDIVNIFEKGTLVKNENKLNFKYSKYDFKFIIKNHGSIFPTIENIKQVMIEFIFNTEWNYSFENSDYEINNTDLFNLIVPKKLLNDITIINFYFTELCKLVNAKYPFSDSASFSIFDFEKIKISSLEKCLDLLKSKISKDVRKMPKSFHLLSLYNKFYSDKYSQYSILYNNNDMQINNLLERISFFKNSININFEMDFTKQLIDDIDFIVIKFENIFGDINCFNLVTVDVYSNIKDNLSEYSFFMFDGDFIEFDISDEFYFYDWTDAFFYKNYIVFIPKDITVAKTKSLKRNIEYDRVYIEKIISIKAHNDFVKCVQNITSQREITYNEAEKLLVNFLADKDSKYFVSVLKIISLYKPFEKNDYETFKKDICDLLNKSQNITTIPLKNYIVDDNGLNKLLSKYTDLFGRGKPYLKKLTNNLKNFERGNVKKNLAIISDIGISGAQLKDSFKYYLENGYDTKKDNKFYDFNKEIFLNNFKQAKKITILNCLYTDVYENEVREFFNNKFKICENNIIFLGKRIIVNTTKYSYLKVHTKYKLLFFEFVKKYYPESLNKLIFKNTNYTYDNYLRDSMAENLTEIIKCRFLLLLRCHSLPKYHHKVFDDLIFEYRAE